ncbi:Pentatricopeptide repeat-containing protein [Artemisia annua]|uniref:Pentatricopeptide repeat-containing protein n=1 Tax=Artemisia annua TaxID=35608 RepID=A0A2U1M3R4_ARTAN|nr:Pentatricopeptide repeat-containing protein [Artemisia annua]
MEIAMTNCDNKIRVEERWREVEVVNGIAVGQLRSFLQVRRLIYSFVTVDACFVLFILQHNRSKGSVNTINHLDDGASIQASRSVLGINAQFKYVSLRWHNFGKFNICGWVQKVVCFKEHLIRDVFKPFYQPKAGTYMKLIVLLGRSGQPQHARNLFNMMIGEGLEPTAELYTALLAAYRKQSLYLIIHLTYIHIRFMDSYCFKAIIADETPSIIVTCFSLETDSLVKKCDELLISTAGLVGSPYQHCEDDNHSFINAFGNMADTTSAGTEHYYTRSRIQY